jgi:ribokinase
MTKPRIAILGIFVADLAFRAKRLPVMGETLLGQGFAMGPGGKGSNQSVAAARAGGNVSFIAKLGRDSFGDIALKTWAADGIDTSHVAISDTSPTGAAFIFVSSETGDNAIIVEAEPRALTADDVSAAEKAISGSQVCRRSLRPPLLRAGAGWNWREAWGDHGFQSGTCREIVPAIYALCDYVTPE